MSEDKGGWFGQSGYRETRRGGLREDIARPALQSFALVILNAATVFGVYLAFRYFFPDEAAWEILSVAGLLSAITYFTLRVWNNRRENGEDKDGEDDKSQSPESSPDAKDDRATRGRILTLLGAAGVITLVLWIVVGFAGPWVADHLYHDPVGVAIIAILFGASRAYGPTALHYVKEMTDGLWNSDARYAIRQRELEWEREKFKIEQAERQKALVDQLQAELEDVYAKLGAAERKKPVKVEVWERPAPKQTRLVQTSEIEDYDRLMRFVKESMTRLHPETGHERGFSRAAWVGTDAGKTWGFVITDPEWDRFFRVLSGAGLVKRGRPTPGVTLEDIIDHLRGTNDLHGST